MSVKYKSPRGAMPARGFLRLVGEFESEHLSSTKCVSIGTVPFGSFRSVVVPLSAGACRGVPGRFRRVSHLMHASRFALDSRRQCEQMFSSSNADNRFVSQFIYRFQSSDCVEVLLDASAGRFCVAAESDFEELREDFSFPKTEPKTAQNAAAAELCLRMSMFLSRHTDTEHLFDGRFYRSDWAPFDAHTLDSIELTMSRFAWSPCQWYRGIRKQDNFGRANLLVLDFDDGETSLAQAENIFSDSIHVIGTTHNHQVEKHGRKCDRFRVVLLLSDEIEDLATYRATMQFYVNKYGTDPACVDGARFYWPCTQIVDVVTEGYTWEIVQPKPGSQRRAEIRYPTQGILRRRSQMALNRAFPMREYNNTCFMIAKDMLDAGYTADEIYGAIVRSPTYIGKIIGKDLEDEIFSCIRSGIKSVKEGRAYGRREGPGSGAEEEREARQKRGHEE